MDKNTLQLVNIGLSIFNKLQTIQHRQIRMNNDLAKQQLLHRRNQRRNANATDAELISATETNSQRRDAGSNPPDII